MAGYLKSNRYKIIFFIFALMLASLPFFETIATGFIFKPKISEMTLGLRLKHDKILTDLKTLEEHPLFSPFTTEKNAEWAIAQQVPWHGENSPIYDTPQTIQVKKITRFYGAWRHDPETLQKILSDKMLMEIDTSWISRLEKYDHWNFSTHRELSTPLALIPKVNSMTRMEIFSQLPIPNYAELRNWSLLHFFQKAQENKAYEGLKAHRKVTELIHSSGTLLGNVTAAAMLKDEYLLVSRFDIKNWETKPILSIDSYSRVSWAWIGLIKTSFFQKLPQKFLPYMKPQNGICAGARETAASYALYLDFFSPRTTLESDFSDNVAFSSKIFHKLNTDCNHSNYKAFLSRSPASVQPWKWSSLNVNADLFKNYAETDFDFTIADNWIYLPFVRRFVGLSLFSNGSPINYTVHYDAVRSPFAGINYKTVF